MEKKALDICKRFIAGQWGNITNDEIVVKQLSGGYNNQLYYCSLPEGREPVASEPKHVVLRLYGIGTTIPGDDYKITDSLIALLLSERGLGPKLYGVFPGGRLEEFIPSRPMTSLELKDRELMAKIAKKLAAIHTMDVPIDKGTDSLFTTMEKWVQSVHTPTDADAPAQRYLRPELEREMTTYDYRRELRWLRRVLPECVSPVVFTHNDLAPGNVLICDNPQAYGGDGLLIIDYEWAAYTCRGYDFAKYFTEHLHDYSEPNYPYFRVDFDAYPTDEEKRHFFRQYIKHSPDLSAGKETEDRLIREADYYSLAPHLIESLWALRQARTSQQAFGFWENSKARLMAYEKHKAWLIKTYGILNE